MKILGTWTETSEESLANKIEEIKRIISGTEGKKMNTFVKENVKSK